MFYNTVHVISDNRPTPGIWKELLNGTGLGGHVTIYLHNSPS